MAKQKEESNRLNRIKPMTNIIFNLIFLILGLACVTPVILVFIISITKESELVSHGYSFFPKALSLSAYSYLWNERKSIGNALLISALVTVLGTLIGLALTTTMGYVLSRSEYKLKGFFSWVVFIPMIFNGGMVANYVVVANFLNLRNTIWCLILPLSVSSFNVIISKTFFKSTIPDSIVESAKIDGASEFTIFSRIIVPISKPVFATIGLFLSFGYWNDWFQSSLYISEKKLTSLQALLNNMIQNIQYIASNPTAGLSLQQYKNSMPTESIRMAIAVLVVIPIACVYPFFQRYFISGLTVGAVKG